jgi:hypothetical protein
MMIIFFEIRGKVKRQFWDHWHDRGGKPLPVAGKPLPPDREAESSRIFIYSFAAVNHCVIIEVMKHGFAGIIKYGFTEIKKYGHKQAKK